MYFMKVDATHHQLKPIGCVRNINQNDVDMYQRQKQYKGTKNI